MNHRMVSCIFAMVLCMTSLALGQKESVLYVKVDANGNGDGSSWDNAFNSINTALASADVDTVIYISGGNAGYVYNESAILNKPVTLKGSFEPAHSGRVIWAGEKIIANTTGVVTIENMDFTVYSPDQYPLVLHQGSFSVFKDINLEGIRTLDKQIEVWGGTTSFTRCRFADQYQSSLRQSRGFKTHSSASIVEFNYCIFDYGAGTVDILTPDSTWEFVNCLFAMPTPHSPTTHAVRVADDPSISATFVNCIFLGNYPVRSETNATGILSSNCFWHRTIGPGLYVRDFDFANASVINNDLTDVLPHFDNVRNSKFGAFAIRVDDMGNSDEARQGAEILNPEVLLSFYTNGHSRYKHGYYSITKDRVEDWRYLVNNGNEVGGHGSTHSDSSDMSAIFIRALGHQATVSVHGNRTGDSSTWHGTLRVMVGSVLLFYDLLDPQYDTLGELVEAIDGTIVGYTLLTAQLANNQGPSINPDMISAVLADVVEANIARAEGYVLKMDEAGYVRFEIRENIEDIQAYIRTGMDRNGENPSGAGPAEPGSPAETYRMHTFATADGVTSPAVLEELLNDSNIWGASTASPEGNHSGNIYHFGALPFSLYGFLTDTMPDGPRIFAQALGANVSSHVTIHTWHSVPQYDDGNGPSTAKLKDLCLSLNVGERTFSDILYHIRTSGDWTISSENAIFTGNKDDYLMTGHFTLTHMSPFIDMGIELGQRFDFVGNPISDIPDVGIYEFQK